VGTVAVVLLALFTLSSRTNRARGDAASCRPAAVHYERARTPSRLPELPWTRASNNKNMPLAFLPSILDRLGDARIREADGLTVYASQPEDIMWAGGRRPSHITIAAERISGDGSLKLRTARLKGGSLRTRFDTSAPGCWRMTVRAGSARGTLVVRAIGPPRSSPCDATKVFQSRVAATPATSGITAAVGWKTIDDESLIYSGGRTPDGGNTKVLWAVAAGWGSTLALSGHQLDRRGQFTQTLRMAIDPPGAFPSIVVIPQPGCWALIARTGHVGGIVVVHSARPSGRS
jgi:hypothetical protein